MFRFGARHAHIWLHSHAHNIFLYSPKPTYDHTVPVLRLITCSWPQAWIDANCYPRVAYNAMGGFVRIFLIVDS